MFLQIGGPFVSVFGHSVLPIGSGYTSIMDFDPNKAYQMCPSEPYFHNGTTTAPSGLPSMQYTCLLKPVAV